METCVLKAGNFGQPERARLVCQRTEAGRGWRSGPVALVGPGWGWALPLLSLSIAATEALGA